MTTLRFNGQLPTYNRPNQYPYSEQISYLQPQVPSFPAFLKIVTNSWDLTVFVSGLQLKPDVISRESKQNSKPRLSLGTYNTLFRYVEHVARIRWYVTGPPLLRTYCEIKLFKLYYLFVITFTKYLCFCGIEKGFFFRNLTYDFSPKTQLCRWCLTLYFNWIYGIVFSV